MRDDGPGLVRGRGRLTQLAQREQPAVGGRLLVEEDTLGPLTGPVTTSFPCDPVTSAAYAAVVAGSLVGTIGQTVPPHTPGKKPL